MTNVQRWAACLMVLGLVGFVDGCRRTNDPANAAPAAGLPTAPAAAGAPDTESGPFAAGKKVFAANNCARCHTIGGAGGPAGGGPMAGGARGPGGPGGKMGQNRGPDLGKVGRDPAHTVDWLMAHIRNPKAHKSQSRMPPFEGKIHENDLRALAEYLASLK
jgi:mono/diheme cytochrome c family protein